MKDKKVALITGAASGIGKAIYLKLVDDLSRLGVKIKSREESDARTSGI